MVLFNLFMGVGGLLLAGDSVGQAARTKNMKLIPLACAELAAGLYFSIAAIGSVPL
jgi:hypothetical protein